jgi:hypothetical protein
MDKKLKGKKMGEANPKDKMDKKESMKSFGYKKKSKLIDYMRKKEE